MIIGEDTGELGLLMEQLANNLTGGELNFALRQLSILRDRNEAEIFKEYDLFLTLRQKADMT